ncbi:DUF1800 domain-containing protein [Sulfitobacter sp. HNIBRBA2951]|uniref:DUF1800 domain-containing protein n=1 Tax=Sulfitobacter aquimarinus TaxID=3158557 RepID=UPI0032E01C36
MRFDPHLAEIRFGCGLSPTIAPAQSTAQMLAGVAKPDDMAARFPIEPFADFQTRIAQGIEFNQIRRKNRGSDEALAAKKARRVLNKETRIAQVGWLGQHINRWVHTDTPLRERLTLFWADHFTATGKAGLIRRAASPYVETAIRPHITGRFEDMLMSAVLHPLMLHYLDQAHSVGENSAQAARGGKLRGMNENLAREVLELHTLGVHAAYTQTDVRELAELFTGLTHTKFFDLQFRKQFAEPGTETVLERTYGGTKNPHIRDVKAVLHDLARHPATARHIATKLAVHFTGDTPDPALVAALETRFRDTDGDLAQVTAALVEHPAAWAPQLQNVKPAFNFLASACRALALPSGALPQLEERLARRLIVRPMGQMGHFWEKPAGPDGLPEEDAAWISPQGVAARLQWAITVPQQLMDAPPDPRDFVHSALGPHATAATVFAAKAAESRWDGVGLVLASPAFQRT